MVVVPAATPVAVPDVEPIVAIPVLELLHTPPEVASVSVVVLPTVTLSVPDIAAGFGLTVMVVATLQPVDNVYDITAVPGVTPVTIPVVEPIVAEELLLVQVPPVVALLNVVVAP